MQVSTVPFAAIKRLLQEAGFVAEKYPNGCNAFSYPDTNSVILLPQYDDDQEEFVYYHHLAVIRHDLDYLDLMERADFDRFVAKYQRRSQMQKCRISFADFSRVLAALGFELAEHPDHNRFIHSSTQAQIALPKQQPQDIVETVHLSITEHILDEHDLIQAAAFIKLLKNG
jgi:hypothetical protein